MIALASETTDPRDRPPTILLPNAEVRLLQIVGILFDTTPIYPRPKHEAELDEQCTALQGVEVAFKVRGESALPLVLEGQTIVAGARMRPDHLESSEGELVVIVTSEGTTFKRVGKTIPGAPHVRQFESIGGLGESILVRTEELEDDPVRRLPLLQDARRILGVLYDPNQ